MMSGTVYATEGDLSSFIGIDSGGTLAGVMTDCLATASRVIDKATNRFFGKSALQSRYYTPTWDCNTGRWIVRTDDIASTAGLVVNVDNLGDQSYSGVIASSGYVLMPRNAPLLDEPWPYTSIEILRSSITQPMAVEGQVKVTALFGWSDIPVSIHQATLTQANRLFSRREAPFGIAGAGEPGTGETRLLAKLDPDVAIMVKPYYRWWGAV